MPPRRQPAKPKPTPAPKPVALNDLPAMREYRRMRVKGAPIPTAREAAVQKRTPQRTGRGIGAPR